MKRGARRVLIVAAASVIAVMSWSGAAFAQAGRTNIVVIWGDDIGQSNLGFRTVAAP